MLTLEGFSKVHEETSSELEEGLEEELEEGLEEELDAAWLWFLSKSSFFLRFHSASLLPAATRPSFLDLMTCSLMFI